MIALLARISIASHTDHTDHTDYLTPTDRYPISDPGLVP